MRGGTLVNQVRRVHPKFLGEPFEDHDRRVTRATLDVAHVGPMNLRALCEFFLAPAPGIAGLPKVRTEALADIHARQKYGLSTIGLQTISDIMR